MVLFIFRIREIRFKKQVDQRFRSRQTAIKHAKAPPQTGMKYDVFLCTGASDFPSFSLQ